MSSSEVHHHEISDTGSWSLRRLGQKIFASVVAGLVLTVVTALAVSWVTTRDTSQRLESTVQRHEQQIGDIEFQLRELQTRSIKIDSNTQHMREQMDLVLRRIERRERGGQ